MQNNTVEHFFSTLWQDYLRMAPQVKAIQQVLMQYNRSLINDHVAFRTLNLPAMDMSKLESLIFSLDYQVLDDYHFPDKHLTARAYIHPDRNIAKIFLSQLHIDQLSEQSQKIIHHHTSTHTELPQDTSLFYCGRKWILPSWDEYKILRSESEYAAWFMTFGFHANHFTLDVNAFNQNSDRSFNWPELIELIESIPLMMNSEGSIIKGSPEVLLEQASTLADEIDVKFDQGIKSIKSCFYELAKRFPQPDGKEYQGFVTANANQIFSSTNSV